MSEATAEGVAWDLSDLYSGADDPALDRDAESALSRARALRETYAGRIA